MEAMRAGEGPQVLVVSAASLAALVAAALLCLGARTLRSPTAVLQRLRSRTPIADTEMSGASDADEVLVRLRGEVQRDVRERSL